MSVHHNEVSLFLYSLPTNNVDLYPNIYNHPSDHSPSTTLLCLHFSPSSLLLAAENPAIDNLDISELKTIRDSVKPFRTFLMQPYIRAVLPEGVVIPPETINVTNPDNVATLNLPNNLIITLMLMMIALLLA